MIIAMKMEMASTKKALENGFVVPFKPKLRMPGEGTL